VSRNQLIYVALVAPNFIFKGSVDVQM